MRLAAPRQSEGNQVFGPSHEAAVEQCGQLSPDFNGKFALIERGKSFTCGQPGFFEQGSESVFTSATRTYDVYFPYPWSEQDNIEIKMPTGYTVDSPDIPAEIADSQKIGRLKIGMRIDKAQNILYYDRYFHFGGGGRTLFPVAAYPAVKGLFDGFHKANTHAVSLKALP